MNEIAELKARVLELERRCEINERTLMYVHTSMWECIALLNLQLPDLAMSRLDRLRREEWAESSDLEKRVSIRLESELELIRQALIQASQISRKSPKKRQKPDGDGEAP